MQGRPATESGMGPFWGIFVDLCIELPIVSCNSETSDKTTLDALTDAFG